MNAMNCVEKKSSLTPRTGVSGIAPMFLMREYMTDTNTIGYIYR